MNIITGASGQVGSNIVREIAGKGFPVRAVVRNPTKVTFLNAEISQADFFDSDQLTNAFRGGTTVFLLTPENPASNDIIEDTRKIVENYKKAIRANGIKRVVGLSCIGAHIEGNTGNIIMSSILERAFDGMGPDAVFVRPSYYYSNWLGFLGVVEAYGVLPTFFPENLKIEMHSPVDVAKFVAEIMTGNWSMHKKFYELAGPQQYSSQDVANILSGLLHKNVIPQPVPQEEWKNTLLGAGFTENTANNLADMTLAVIDNVAAPQIPLNIIRLTTTLETYLDEQLKK